MYVPSPRTLRDRLRARVRGGRGSVAARRAGPAAAREAGVARADELEAAGDLVGAIRVLTEANREQRDLDIENRLLDLRFRAFDQERGRLPASPPWPDDVVDLWPDQAVPTVDRDELTVETLRSGIRNHGSILVRGLLDDGQVARMRDCIDRSIAAYDAVEEGEVPPELDGWYAPTAHCPGEFREWKRRAGAVLAVDSPPALFDLVEVFDRTGIAGLAESYFGEAPMLLARKTTLRKVPHLSWRPGDWHQDGAFMGTDIRSLNVWFALTHCGDDAPGLDIVGRRLDHLAQTGTDGAGASWSVGVAVAEREGAGRIVRPIFEAGDALVFDHMMLHRTAIEAEMVNDRYAVETWLLAPSTYEGMRAWEADPAAPTDQRPFWL